MSYFALYHKKHRSNQTFFVEFFVSYFIRFIDWRTRQRMIGAFFIALNADILKTLKNVLITGAVYFPLY